MNTKILTQKTYDKKNGVTNMIRVNSCYRKTETIHHLILP